MICNLGTALTILARNEAREIDLYADLYAMNAPGECSRDVARGSAARARRARKHAESIARRPMRLIRREAAQRGCPIGSPRYEALIDRLRRFPY